MTKNQKKHLSLENREVIEAALSGERPSARAIARSLGVSASTVTREVHANRTMRERKIPKGSKASSRCAHYSECQASGTACEKCSTRLTTCKQCRTRRCIEACPSYERTQCPTTKKWPYVCPAGCPRRAYCGYPLCSYSAEAAQAAYETRLSSSRAGVDLDQGELESLNRLVVPLVRQGQSFGAIWATHKDELGISERTAYRYQEAGLVGCASIELPRKVRMRKRKKRRDAPARDRVDRAGRTYADFCGLPLGDMARAVQADSVEGREGNKHDILSLHLVAEKFQFYLYKDHASTQAVVAWLDAMERSLGSPEAFEAVFGVLLADRGVEFDDWEGMERSCLVEGERRCRVFYCDAMNSNQKAAAERNHEQLRRILPKKRSDFDALSAWDVAVCASHVNSYPTGGDEKKCAFERLGGLVPQSLLDELGYERVAPDDVVLKPWLMPHAVKQ